MKYFKVQEFVSKKFYADRGDKAIYHIDSRAIKFIEELRGVLGKSITINDWSWGGKFQHRGYRTTDSSDYSPHSQHSDGRALDFDVKGMTANEVREFLIANVNNSIMKDVSFIESDCNWVHIDFRYSEFNDLIVWSMKTHKSNTYRK